MKFFKGKKLIWGVKLIKINKILGNFFFFFKKIDIFKKNCGYRCGSSFTFDFTNMLGSFVKPCQNFKNTYIFLLKKNIYIYTKIQAFL